MKRGSLIGGAVLVLGIVAGSGAPVDGQAAAPSVGTVRIPQAVRANGQALAAGTYSVRLTSEGASTVVGQSGTSARWVEFVQGGQVRGRELATVVTSSDIAVVGKTKTPPAPGTARVQALRGAEYVRVWLNSGGTHYLVHLSTSPK